MSLDYKYSPMNIRFSQIVQTAETEKKKFCIIQSLGQCNNIMMLSKKESDSDNIIAQTAYLLGQNLVQIDCTLSLNYHQLSNVFKGLVQTGFLVHFSNFDKL